MSGNLKFLYGFSVMTQNFAHNSALCPGSQIFLSEKHERIRKSYSFSGNDLKYEIISAKNLLRKPTLRILLEQIFIFYSYLKSCVWLLPLAVTLAITRFMREKFFKKEITEKNSQKFHDQ